MRAHRRHVPGSARLGVARRPKVRAILADSYVIQLSVHQQAAASIPAHPVDQQSRNKLGMLAAMDRGVGNMEVVAAPLSSRVSSGLSQDGLAASPKDTLMKSHTPLFAALLLGSVSFAAPALADDQVPPPEGEAASVEAAAPEVPVAPQDEVAAGDAATDAIEVAEVTDEPSDAEDEEEVVTEAPAPWVGRVRITAEPQPGPDGQPVADRELRLVQRSATGGALARKAVLSLLSGTVGGSTFNKHQLHGTRVESVPNPAFNYLKSKMRDGLGTYFAAHPGAVPEEDVLVESTVGEFTLVYKELGDAETEYELRQTMHVGFPYRRKLLRLTGGEGAHCSVAEPVSAPLEAWQADDYAMAKQVAQRYTDECAAKFVASLPTLFPDRSPVAVEQAAVPVDVAAPATTVEGEGV